jgi:hypothetical protein
MTTYDDDDVDEGYQNEDQPLEEEEVESAEAGNNRNFYLALGILGGLFLVVTIVLVLLWLNNQQPSNGETASINATNVAIKTANAQTAIAATEASALRLTPSATPVPPTATATPLLAQATNTPASDTSGGGAAAGAVTPTANQETQSAVVVLTESAQKTQTQQVMLNMTATSASLPQSGFADEVGLPGLFGMALGLVLVIILVRRLRLSSNH